MKYTLILSFLISTISSCFLSHKCVEKNNPDCICTLQYDPVCGCNQKTYGNACAAECAGIKKYTKGECPQNATVKLEGMLWQLTNFTAGPKPPSLPADVTITIKLENGKLNGFGGCNNIGGGYIHDGNSLKVSELFGTKKYCENTMKWESLFLEQLAKSQTYEIKGSVLEIKCGDMGNLVFRLAQK